MQCEKCGNEVKPPGGCRNGICYSCSLSALESGLEESLWLVRMRLDMDANRIADEDEDEQDIEEKRYLLALRKVIQHVDSQAKRIADLERLLTGVISRCDQDGPVEHVKD